MLILTRRVGESIKVGQDITVTVLGVKGMQVRLGIDAPKNVAVHREEVAERINTNARTKFPKRSDPQPVLPPADCATPTGRARLRALGPRALALAIARPGAAALRCGDGDVTGKLAGDHPKELFQ